MPQEDLYCEMSKVTYERMVKVLNTALKYAPDVINEILSAQYMVDGDDPLAVGLVLRQDKKDGPCSLSALGLINSLLLSKKWRIAAICADGDLSETITGFKVLELPS